MELLKTALLLTVLLALNALVANGLSWVLTEWKRPLYNFKPFNCRACLSFWLTNISGVALVVYFGDDGLSFYLLGLAVLLCGFINYLYINSKIKIYE